jgi:lipoprotein-anchoring transpeptidase ErfK/SrfK
MTMVMTHLVVVAAMLAFGQQAPAQPTAQQPPIAKAKQTRAQPREKTRQNADAKLKQMVAVQVALDRAGFSSGVIDGREGKNTTRALEAYRKQNGADPQPSDQPLTTYQITEQDAAGPFARVPRDMMEQSTLPALSYESVAELVAERFHTTPQFLQTLNPNAKLAAGESITVPNVEPFALPTKEMSLLPAKTGAKANAAKGSAEPKATGTAGRTDAAKPDTAAARAPVTITVSRSASALTVTGEDGKILVYAPVTTGSEHDPLPLGEWKVTGTFFNPPFRYNPALFWDADPSHSKATIPPGPNGPVGVVWIDLSKEHYGIHGTAEPSTIGRTQSHGCVRLTNWDATRVGSLASPGTVVRFVE